MPREWQPLVADNLSNTGKLVHLALRNDAVDAERYRAQLLTTRRRAYEQELSLQAQRVGCNGRQGRLSEGDTLSAFNDESKEEAEAIVASYNYDLAVQIQAIRNETPTANRTTYAKRLAEWDTKRAAWKAKQIAEWTEGRARGQAVKDFMFNNGLENEGYVTVEPQEAAEEICQGLVNRGQIPMREAQNISLPAHINCQHFFVTHPAKVSRSECPDLWTGQ
jgi:hypothetical protein